MQHETAFITGAGSGIGRAVALDLAGAGVRVALAGRNRERLGPAREERGRGIRSTVLYPGEVNTEFLDIRAGRPGAVDETRKANILQPADIAATVRFLAELPPHAHVPELVIKPTIDDFS